MFSRGLTRRYAGVLAGVIAVFLMVLPLAGPSAGAQVPSRTAASPPAVTGNDCPTLVYAADASFYPVQPSFHAGYDNVWENLNQTTASWAYVISAQFPYSQWMSWNLYNLKGAPLFTFNRTTIQPDPGSLNPFQSGVPVLAPTRSYHLYLMPASTPASVISTMKAQFGSGNVGTLPAIGSTKAWAATMRSYWSFAFNGGAFASYDRFGFGGPTHTPYPTIHAFLTDPTTGALTNLPAGNCGAQSLFPKHSWYNPATGKPVITAAPLPRPVARIQNVPQFFLNHGFFVGSAPAEAPPAYVPQYVQFYRNPAANSPYADVSQLPAAGNPPDACGGYVVANLPNNRVSLIHVPQVPSFPNYTGATDSTLRTNSDNVQYYSLIQYGVNRQIYSFGNPNPLQALRNSELGNQEIAKTSDGSATFVIYPDSANLVQVARMAAIAKANGWNILHGGVKTRAIPLNMLLLREKGQNSTWPNALSANTVTQGAPCPQSTTPSLPFNQDPPSAQVTQFNGMGLTAPNGENCTIQSFVTGNCLKALVQQYKKFNWQWNAANTFPSPQL